MAKHKPLHKKVFYVNDDNNLMFKDNYLYKFNIVDINDENNLNFSIDEALRRLNKNRHLKKVFDNIIDFRIETLRNADGEIFQQDIKLKYIIDEVIDIRKVSFSFYGNKFMLGI